MIKLLFFIPELSGGGAEKVLCNLVNNMNQSKFDITVHTLYPCEPGRFLVEGIKYRSVFKKTSSWRRKIQEYWYRFCSEFKLLYPLYIKGDYDIEVAYLECDATKVISASTNKKAKKIAWVHCDLIKKGIISKKTAKFYSKYDRVVCVSQDVKKSFDCVFKSIVDSIVLSNVIDEDEIYEKANQPCEFIGSGDEKQLLAVGRLTEQKNFPLLIETCKKLKDDGYRFHLNILGEGPDRKLLENKITGLGLDKDITLQGFTVNPYPWIKVANVIVCSSLYEGISTVVQEAILLNKMVVTTPCTGMEELLGASEYGIIVEPDEDGLYLGLKKVFENPSLETDYSQKAEERSSTLKKENSVTNIETFFINEVYEY